MQSKFLILLLVALTCQDRANAEPQEVPIPKVQQEIITPPFKDGDEIIFWCAGNIEGNRFLDGETDGNHIKLSLASDSRFPGTHWRVKAHGDGTVSFECLGAHEGARWLNGYTPIESAAVTLVASPNKKATGAFWKVYALGEGEFALRCQGDLAGVRWLNGYTVDSSVSLTPETIGKYTGTHWKFRVVPGPSPSK